VKPRLTKIRSSLKPFGAGSHLMFRSAFGSRKTDPACTLVSAQAGLFGGMSTGRFSKLDFSNQPQPQGETQQDKWPDLDEMQCLAIAKRHFFAGDYETALSAFSRTLRFNKDLAEGWSGQIECLIELGEYPEAAIWCDRSLERFRDHPDLLALKGLALALDGKFAAGMEYADGAVKLRSPSPLVWVTRGRIMLLKRQSIASAHRCFQKAMELTSDKWETATLIGRYYNRVNLFAYALPPLREAFRKGGETPPILYELSICLEGLGEFDQAAGYLRKTLAIDPEYKSARIALERVSSTNPVSKIFRKLTAKKKI